MSRRTKRRKPRPELRGRSARWQLYESAADLGDNLLVIRDERRYEQAGFESFEDWCRDLAATGLPADWQLTPEQSGQLIDAALELAARRRRQSKRGSGTRC